MMKHSEFVEGYRSGRLGARINKASAARRFRWTPRLKSPSRLLLELALADDFVFDEIVKSEVLVVKDLK